MKVGFYSPYIPDSTIGGGEKHFLDMAQVFAQDHQVHILVRNSLAQDLESKKRRYEQFFNIDLSQVSFTPTPLGEKTFFLKKLLWTREFDYLMALTDGSLFFSLAKINNLHLQNPHSFKKESFLDRLKLRNWQYKNAISEFTKKVVENSWDTNVPYVIYPKVNLEDFNPKHKKQKVILHVGRFFRQLHSKKQDILVAAFKKMVDQQQIPDDWKLVLIGAAEDDSYFQEVVAAAQGYNITVLDSVSRDKLINWYNRASIYWHATGYGINQDEHPEKAEHFGITTVEAMAAGAVPVVINKGGQPEILGADLTDNLWETSQELQKITAQIINNENIYRDRQHKAIQRAEYFSEENFNQSVKQMIVKTSS